MNIKKISFISLLIAALLTVSGCCCTAPFKAAEKDESAPASLDSSKSSDEKTESFPEEESSEIVSQEPSQEPDDIPSQPEDDTPKLITPDRDMRYRFNIFLSNFSEQWFCEEFVWSDYDGDYILKTDEFVAETADVTTMVEFAHLYAKINHNKAETVIYEGIGYDGVSLYTINLFTERFFKRSVTASDIPTGEPMSFGGYSLIVVDNMVCRPAADGGTFNNMTVLDKIHDLGDGIYKVEFNIFSVDNDEIAPIGGTIQDKSVYYYTTEQADSRSDFYRHLNGIAVIEPYVDAEGKDRIYLHSYELFED